ncbi:hypothetical protein EGW08_002529 [Elysia chlorotica]|uniref:Uncharacterized protein n=1 Tax=Elysia chlorotica TaxID=188477 RepID=A0A3S1AEF1_ELYCH|nr:hypothetical protein EGW08_002529 [Elysia chlorotica]
MLDFDEIVGKLRRRWITIHMAFRYGRWSVRRLIFSSAFFICSLVLIYNFRFAIDLLPWNPSVDHWCEREKAPDYILQPESDEMTVVTMFLDLGIFKKGEQRFAYHSPYKYRSWMRVFGRMANRVVAYIENENDIQLFKEIRSCLPPMLTKIVKIDRKSLPSFKHLPAIRKLYSRPSYPKYYPNTVYPEYSCAMHAKYDVLEQSAIEDPFQTPYFAWVDIGLFRNLDGTNFPLFKIVPPEKFNPERIGFSQVWPQDPVLSPEKIIKEKLVWVSGSMVLATQEYMLNFTRDYKLAVKELLDQGLSNTDQEVINAMYTGKMRKPHYIKIKAYLCHQGQLGLYGPDARYFCLGYVCKHAWEKRVPQPVPLRKS